MLIFRFFEAQNFIINKKFFLTKDNSHKIINVLRLKINDHISVFNDTNIEFIASITAVKSKLVEIEIIQSNEKNLESPIKIHLAQAIAKNDNMDWIIQKATELGVYKITPIITKKSIVKTADQQQKLLRWKSIAIAACCQSGRNIIPKINNPVYFDKFLLDLNLDLYYKFILSPRFPITATMNSHNKNYNHVNSKEQSKSWQPDLLDRNKEIILMIGSESGFTNEELISALNKQFSALTLGPRILRTETAPIVAISILQSKYGDL